MRLKTKIKLFREARHETNDGRSVSGTKVPSGATMEPIMMTIMVLWKKTSRTWCFSLQGMWKGIWFGIFFVKLQMGFLRVGQLVGDGDDSQVPLRTIAFIIIYANVIMHHPRLWMPLLCFPSYLYDAHGEDARFLFRYMHNMEEQEHRK